MFAALAALIPVLGPIFNGVVTLIAHKSDVDLKKDDNSVEVIQARAQLLYQLRDDIGIKVARDLAMYPPIIYVGTYFWDRWVDTSHPTWVWGVLPLQLDWATSLPIMAVYTFLFALAWRGPR